MLWKFFLLAFLSCIYSSDAVLKRSRSSPVATGLSTQETTTAIPAQDKTTKPKPKIPKRGPKRQKREAAVTNKNLVAYAHKKMADFLVSELGLLGFTNLTVHHAWIVDNAKAIVLYNFPPHGSGGTDAQLNPFGLNKHGSFESAALRWHWGVMLGISAQDARASVSALDTCPIEFPSKVGPFKIPVVKQVLEGAQYKAFLHEYIGAVIKASGLESGDTLFTYGADAHRSLEGFTTDLTVQKGLHPQNGIPNCGCYLCSSYFNGKSEEAMGLACAFDEVDNILQATVKGERDASRYQTYARRVAKEEPEVIGSYAEVEQLELEVAAKPSDKKLRSRLERSKIALEMRCELGRRGSLAGVLVLRGEIQDAEEKGQDTTALKTELALEERIHEAKSRGGACGGAHGSAAVVASLYAAIQDAEEKGQDTTALKAELALEERIHEAKSRGGACGGACGEYETHVSSWTVPLAMHTETTVEPAPEPIPSYLTGLAWALAKVEQDRAFPTKTKKDKRKIQEKRLLEWKESKKVPRKKK